MDPFLRICIFCHVPRCKIAAESAVTEFIMLHAQTDICNIYLQADIG